MKTSLVILCFFRCIFSFASSVSPNLTAIYDPQSKAVKLSWQNNEPDINTYILQRSADNIKWSDLHKVESTQFTENKIEKYIDRHPDANKNHYRLQIIKAGGVVELTRPLLIILGNPDANWVMFPVPVTTMLNLQYTGSEKIAGVISVFISNAQGKVLTRLRSSSLVRNIQIPVSNLGKGIYDVKIVVLDKIIWNQRFVK